MYRLTGLLFIFSLFSFGLQSQVYIEGIVKTSYPDYKTGDTATFAGATEKGDNNRLYYILKSSHDLIPADDVLLVLDGVDFWDIQQFYYASYDIISKGWQTNIRKELEQKTLSLLAKLESENKIYEDLFAEDYLQRLIQKIHHPEFSKGRSQFMNIKILNSDKKICYAFDNGTILISTELLADTENEQQLLRILTEAVAHILLNSNIDHVDKNSQSDYGQLGAVYSQSTKKRVRLIAEKYLRYYEKRSVAEPYSSQITFFNSMASIIGYTAWQEYYGQQYKKALLNINKLVEYEIANSSDYLLLAKIYLKLSHSAEANQKALGFLKKAAELEDQPLPDIYSEMGLIQITERQFKQAKESFKKYHAMVVATKDENKQYWALKMINTCNVFINLSETRYAPADSLDVKDIQIIE